MSHLVVCDIGEAWIQDSWISVLGASLRLSLFKNNVTPDASFTIASVTKADFQDYADQTPTFGAAVNVGGKATITDSAVRSFVMGMPGTTNTIYGYYVWFNAGGIIGNQLLWAERFDTPVGMTNQFDEIDITLKFTLFSEF